MRIDTDEAWEVYENGIGMEFKEVFDKLAEQLKALKPTLDRKYRREYNITWKDSRSVQN
jgi:hypothetical protein